MVENIKNVLKLHLLSKLKLHHMIYRLPAISEFLEELVSTTLLEHEFDNDWKPNRNKVMSKDFALKSGETFSVKSGLFDPRKNTLTFSGSRLGKHSNIDDMVNAINTNHADYYICVAKDKNDWSPTPESQDDKIYYLFVFESSDLSYNGEWSNDGSRFVLNSPGFTAKIEPSMSHQLWTTVDISKIGQPERLVV